MWPPGTHNALSRIHDASPDSQYCLFKCAHWADGAPPVILWWDEPERLSEVSSVLPGDGSQIEIGGNSIMCEFLTLHWSFTHLLLGSEISQTRETWLQIQMKLRPFPPPFHQPQLRRVSVKRRERPTPQGRGITDLGFPPLSPLLAHGAIWATRHWWCNPFNVLSEMCRCRAQIGSVINWRQDYKRTPTRG